MGRLVSMTSFHKMRKNQTVFQLTCGNDHKIYVNSLGHIEPVSQLWHISNIFKLEIITFNSPEQSSAIVLPLVLTLALFRKMLKF